MNKIQNVVDIYSLFLSKDVSKAIEIYLRNKFLDSFEHQTCLNFYDTKDNHFGEVGLLIDNNEIPEHRAKIIWEKATVRAENINFDVDNYCMANIVNNFLSSKLNTFYLSGKTKWFAILHNRRIAILFRYFKGLASCYEKEKC